MSLENVRAFMTEAENNPELQEKIAKVASQSELTPEALSRIAEEADLPFTAEEFLKASHPEEEQPSGELHDSALEGVTGGVAGFVYDRSSSTKLLQQLESYMQGRNFRER